MVVVREIAYAPAASPLSCLYFFFLDAIKQQGHGVPRPTTNGEMWVFNKTYTQYIPLSIYDLQTWMGQPSICVFDCSAAGLLVTSFIQFMEQRQKVGGCHRLRCPVLSVVAV